MNRDQETRDSIIGAETSEYRGGICRFDSLDLPRLQQLIDEDFVDVEDCQNECPSIGEIRDFMVKYPKVRAHGYSVDKTRSDYRVSLEGVECTDEETLSDPEFMRDFIDTFRFADDFTLTKSHAYCWYD